MDPVSRARDYLLDHVGHMTFPGSASFDAVSQRWLVSVCCRTARGVVVVGDVQLDAAGHVVSAPGRDDQLARLGATAASAS
jgi:hypothetical protein